MSDISVSISIQPIQRSGYLTLTFPSSSPLASDERTFEASESGFILKDDETGTSAVIHFPNEEHSMVPESFKRVASSDSSGVVSERFRFNLGTARYVEVIDYEEATKETQQAAAARKGPIGGDGTVNSISCRNCHSKFWELARSPNCSGRAVEMSTLAPEWRAAGSFFCHHSGGADGELRPRVGEFVVKPFRLLTNCELSTETDGGDGSICPQCHALVGLGEDLFLDAVDLELELENESDSSDEKGVKCSTAFDRLVWAVAKSIPGKPHPFGAILVPVDKAEVELEDGKDELLWIKIMPGRLLHFQETRPLTKGSAEYFNAEFSSGFRLFWRLGLPETEDNSSTPVVPLGRRGFDEIRDQLVEMTMVQGAESKGVSLISVSL